MGQNTGVFLGRFAVWAKIPVVPVMYGTIYITNVYIYI
jgi:hypothetical protein